MGMTMERIVAPIIVRREIYGYIWIIAGHHPLTPLDDLALSRGATIAALMMFNEQSMRKAEEALQGDFFTGLLYRAGDRSLLSEQAQRLGFRLERPHYVLALSQQPRPTARTGPLLEEVRFWLEQQQQQALLIWRDDFLVMVAECLADQNGAGDGKAQAVALLDALSHAGRRLLIGLGGVCESNLERPGAIRQGYEQAREALLIGRAMGQEAGVIVFAELGLLHWLYHLPAETLADNVYLQQIYSLAAYDSERGTDLLRSLEVYLECGGAVQEAAGRLYVHRNTLLHRLERISELCGCDLRTFSHRVNLHAAIKSYRLRAES
jgi:DNA-binding PucR family transcriptional regulator